MSRESILIIIAILVGVSPFAGLPLSWLSWILPLFAFFILIIGVSLRRDRKSRTRLDSSVETSGTF